MFENLSFSNLIPLKFDSPVEWEREYSNAKIFETANSQTKPTLDNIAYSVAKSRFPMQLGFR